MKKVLAGILTAVVLFSFLSCKKKEQSEGKVLNIYVWNDEFKERFYDYFATKVPADVKVNFVTTPNKDNAYQNNLEKILKQQDKASADEKVDIFLVEADYALKFVDTPYTLDVKNDIGLTDEDLSQQFKYTKDIMTDSNGALKGVAWQSCPGGFIYRRSYAKKVLGSDDPAVVQKAINDWNGFDAVAAKMKAAGYYMLSGYDDAYRVFSDNVSSKWVNDNKITIDPMIYRWIEQTKEYSDKGYNNKAALWSKESTDGMMSEGLVFGYFAPAWFIDFNMPHGEGSAYGDWAFCKGPQSFSWGGTWICGAAGSDNISIIKDLMLTLTCDKKTMIKIAEQTFDFTNNEEAMLEVAASDYKNDFLGGQNHIALFVDSASSINKNFLSAYDQGMSEKIQTYMKDYFEDKTDLESAWENFYSAVLELYPELTK
ncbi:MAG: carbohydrate ABC transporter substrate-binding protein [Treponema sp.]|nr:carbohydrate ABC transporter substrate-binding protein [Treponema sp.]